MGWYDNEPHTFDIYYADTPGYLCLFTGDDVLKSVPEQAPGASDGSGTAWAGAGYRIAAELTDVNAETPGMYGHWPDVAYPGGDALGLAACEDTWIMSYAAVRTNLAIDARVNLSNATQRALLRSYGYRSNPDASHGAEGIWINPQRRGNAHALAEKLRDIAGDALTDPGRHLAFRKSALQTVVNAFTNWTLTVGVNAIWPGRMTVARTGANAFAMRPDPESGQTRPSSFVYCTRIFALEPVEPHVPAALYNSAPLAVDSAIRGVLQAKWEFPQIKCER